MYKKYLLIIVFCLLSTTLLAEFIGPGSRTEITNVSEIKDASKHAKVILTGNIIEQVDHKHYIFKDSTGEITIKIDDDKMYGIKITPSTAVRIYGEIDDDDGFLGLGIFTNNKIDADKIVLYEKPVVNVPKK